MNKTFLFLLFFFFPLRFLFLLEFFFLLLQGHIRFGEFDQLAGFLQQWNCAFRKQYDFC